MFISSQGELMTDISASIYCFLTVFSTAASFFQNVKLIGKCFHLLKFIKTLSLTKHLFILFIGTVYKKRYYIQNKAIIWCYYRLSFFKFSKLLRSAFVGIGVGLGNSSSKYLSSLCLLVEFSATEGNAWTRETIKWCFKVMELLKTWFYRSRFRYV